MDSKKFLPPAKKGGSLSIANTSFLIPIKSVTLDKNKLIGANDQSNEATNGIKSVKKKVIKIADIIDNTFLLKKASNERKRKDVEKEGRKKKEFESENKKSKENKLIGGALVTAPGQSIFDTILRFAAFTALGFIVNNYSGILPKVVDIGKNLKPALDTFNSFASGVVNTSISFIEAGYNAYDSLNKIVNDIGGDGASKIFEQFSSTFTKFLNYTLILASTFKPPNKKVPGGDGHPGGAAGAGGSGVHATSALGGVGGKGTGKVGTDKTTAGIMKTIFGDEVSVAKKPVAPKSPPKPGFGKRFTGSLKPGSGFFRLSVIGGVVDFFIKILNGEKDITRAAVTSAAATAGGILGGAAGTALTGGIAFFSGGFGAFLAPVVIGGISMVGATLFDMLAGAIYDGISGLFGKNKKTYAQGGRVSNGRVPSSRGIKKVSRKPPRVIPQTTHPGKDVGGIKKIELLYGEDVQGQKSGLRVLKDTSSYLKGVSVLNGSLGALMGASVDLAMGQKFDKRLAKQIGDQFGFAIESMIDSQVTNSLSDVSRQFAMANGGVVPTRRLRGGGIAESISSIVSSALSLALNEISTKVLGDITGLISGRKISGGFYGGGDGKYEDFSTDVKAMKAFNYFKKQGYTDFQAAAIVGNLLQENRAMNPRLMNSIGMKGIAQWDANRWSNLEKFASKKKLDPYAFETQLQFIQHELVTGDGGLSSSVFKNTQNLEEATVMFRKKYERPGEAEANDTARIRYARGVLQSSSFEYVPPGKVLPTVTSRFGEQRDGYIHGGTDLAIEAGTPLRALSDGEVVESSFENGWGNYTVFKDKSGLYHLYGHMRSPGRSQGKIKKGDIIGYVGTTGRTTGPHLHWETGTGWNGTITGAFDPLKRYGINAPFNTQKETFKGSKNEPSPIFDWNNRSSIVPTKPTTTDVAMNTSYSQFGMVINNNNTILYQEKILEVPVQYS